MSAAKSDRHATVGTAELLMPYASGSEVGEVRAKGKTLPAGRSAILSPRRSQSLQIQQISEPLAGLKARTSSALPAELAIITSIRRRSAQVPKKARDGKDFIALGRRRTQRGVKAERARPGGNRRAGMAACGRGATDPWGRDTW